MRGAILVSQIVLSVLLVANLCAGFGRDTSLAAADASFTCGPGFDSSGGVLASAGDVNGDGYDDFLIGSSANEVYLILGRASGWAKGTSLADADASFLGESWNDQCGSAVAGVGDVNGDGYDDFVIGALWNNQAAASAGKTYLILGKASGWQMHTSLADADASFLGESPGDMSGARAAGVGDVNGDGFDDFIISAIYNREAGEDTGKTYLIFGRASGWAKNTSLTEAPASFLGEVGFEGAGWAVAGAGDVNGDGYHDFIIGAPFGPVAPPHIGKTYLIFGKPAGWMRNTTLSDADASFLGEAGWDFCGSTLAGIGDLNGDGYDDFVIGAPQWTQELPNAYSMGKTYLILGKPSGWQKDFSLGDLDAYFLGEAEDDSSGESLSGVGDVNNDGYDDFMIGAWQNSQTGFWAGKSYLILGKASGWTGGRSLSDADASFLGEGVFDCSGSAVSGAGDVNGDGCDDFLIGAPGYIGEESQDLDDWTYLLLGRSLVPARPSIKLTTDREDYSAGDTLVLSAGGQNPGTDTVVDVYIGLLDTAGRVYCAPNWNNDISPWVLSLLLPGGFSLEPVPFFEFTLPCSTPPIQAAGTYQFAAVLTEPGNFGNWLSELFVCQFQYEGG